MTHYNRCQMAETSSVKFINFTLILGQTMECQFILLAFWIFREGLINTTSIGQAHQCLYTAGKQKKQNTITTL